METMFKKEFSFIDADRNKVEIECEITTRNGYPEFTISGNYSNGGGQIINHIKPANDAQTDLVNVWKQYHLNGMSAGTDKQNEALRTAGISDYDQSVEYLRTIERVTGKPFPEDVQKGMQAYAKQIERYPAKGFSSAAALSMDFQISFDKQEKKQIENGHGKDVLLRKVFIDSLQFDEHGGKLYQYGTGWITKQLPEDFEYKLIDIIERIAEFEENRKGEPLEDLDDDDLIKLIEEKTNFEGRDAELCAALVRMFKLSEDDLQDIEIDDTRVTVQGTEYLAGDDSEMDDLWDQDLENYLDECVLPDLPKTAQKYFDRDAWKNDAQTDGRGHSLNRYDGGEESARINGTTYYAYRQ